MKRLVLTAMLGLIAGLAQATFELKDPAAQIMEEENEPDNGKTQQGIGENAFCVIEMDDGQCFCIHKETKDRIALTAEECAAIVSKAENIEEP